MSKNRWPNLILVLALDLVTELAGASITITRTTTSKASAALSRHLLAEF